MTRSIALPAPAFPATRSFGVMELAGRRLITAALKHLRHGRITLIDREGRFHAGASDDTGAAGMLPGETIEVRVIDPRFYSAAAFGGSVALAEAYMSGWWETSDLPGLIECITVNAEAMEKLDGPVARLSRPLGRLAIAMRGNSLRGSRRNIEAHYDLGDEFFALFLDPTMTYSCAVFENRAATLEEAQREKIDRACRKLDLQPSDHLLEIGTGWGAMACHAASRYGCRVTTTTISPRQFEFASRRVREAGLEGLVTVVREDYRALAGKFDKIVSIEMIEAVGHDHLGRFFEVVSERLSPRGAALIQAIIIRDRYYESAARTNDFLKKYIFPGSCLPSVEAMMKHIRRGTDLRLWHLEDLAPHYARTLALWRAAFMSRLDEARAMGFTERFLRMWEYYLAYCEGAFRARHVGDVQLLLTKPLCRLAPAGPAAAGIARAPSALAGHASEARCG